MKLIPFRNCIIFGAVMAMAGCAPPPAPPLPPPPPVVQVPPPPPLPADWRDWPVSAGNWHYRKVDGGSEAVFGSLTAASELSIRCELAGRHIHLSRLTSAPLASPVVGQMTLRTSFGTVQWPIVVSTAPGSSTVFALATRTASDAALDRMVFSRGRFAIEVEGASPLVVPNWAEVSRVIEDCRS